MPIGKKFNVSVLKLAIVDDDIVTLKGHILPLEKAILTLQDVIFTL